MPGGVSAGAADEGGVAAFLTAPAGGQRRTRADGQHRDAAGLEHRSP
jgi:hypothetical protein